jgi:hypothetical protein
MCKGLPQPQRNNQDVGRRLAEQGGMMSDNDPYASGLSASHEAVTLTPPPDKPGFGENHAFWIHDEATGLHLNGHLMTCEDVGAYDRRITKLTLLHPNGRTLLLRETGGVSNERTAAGANLRYECLQPFRRWRCSFSGVMQDVTVPRSYMSGVSPEFHRVPVSFEIETEMGAPAWIQGAFTKGGLGPVTSFIGGERYEQLFRAEGEIKLGGEPIIPWSGFGNRTHRYGHRDLNASGAAPRMLGHVWTAALFPSGSGFGLQAYPTADGGILWSEGYIVRDGALRGAEVVQAPWLKNYWTRNERLGIVLKAHDDGEVVEITGETLGAAIGARLPGANPAEQLSLFQGYARFSLAGETAINMIERSLRHGAIETGVGRPL